MCVGERDMIVDVDRFMKLGAVCPECEWAGSVGALTSGPLASDPLSCPKCRSFSVVWPLVTHDTHPTIQ